MSPCFKSLNNGQKLIVVNFALCFSKNHFPQKVGQRMPSAQVISQLIQDFINNTPRRIGFNSNIFSQVKLLKDKLFNKSFT